MKGELRRIKEAIGFLLPPEIGGDHNNMKIESPKNVLTPLVEKMKEQSAKREKEYERRLWVLERKEEENEA